MKALDVAAIALAMVPTVTAQAGTVIETVERVLPSGKETSVVTVQVDNGRMRVEELETGAKAAESAVIFKDDAMIIVDHKKEKYTVMDRATLQQVAGTVSDAMKQLEAQLAGMPPEQRAMVEKMMGKQAPGSQKPRRMAPEFTKAGRTERVGGYTCQVWEGKRDGVKVTEHCVAPYGSVAGGEELMKVMKSMMSMVEDAMQSLDSDWLRGSVRSEWEGIKSIDGYPVLTRTFTDGKADSEHALRSAQSATIAPSQFEVPVGYKRQELGKP